MNLDFGSSMTDNLFLLSIVELDDDLLLHHDEKPQLTRNIEENLKDRSTGSK